MLVAAVIIAVAALLLGGGIGFFAGRSKLQTLLAASEAARASEKEASLAQKELWQSQQNELKKSFDNQLASQKKNFDEQLASQKNSQREAAQAQYEQLKAEFRLLAEKILSEKSEAFEKSGKNQLEALLTPLKTKLDEFKNNAELSRKQTLETNARLSEQIQMLMQSSKALGEEAGMLARALRSDNKLQGNWGEMILDEILSSSGLIENVHYQRQVTLTDDSGNALRNEESNSIMRPDVLVNYPDGKVVVVDSKVSLSAYVDYVNSEENSERDEALQRHIRSVKNHVNELVRKNYSAYIRKSRQEAVDFVVMFMPNEGAYELAMRHDIKLWNEAFAGKVLIVSPVNLMALLQLIHLGWKRFDQERNQQLIIETASSLMERLYAFYDEFDSIGKKLDSTFEAYQKATDRLRGTGGKHSVVKKGEQLKALGVKMNKKFALPGRLQSDDMPEDGSENLLQTADNAAEVKN